MARPRSSSWGLDPALCAGLHERWRGSRLLRAALVAAALLGAVAAWAQPAAPGASAVASTERPLAQDDALRSDSVILNHRIVATFNTTLLGRSPRERALAANTALRVVLDRGGRGEVALWQGEAMVGVQLDGAMVFYLAPDEAEPGSTLAATAEVVRARLQRAVDEVRETTDLHRIGIGVGLSLVATVVAYVLLLGLFALRRRLLARMGTMIATWQPKHPERTLLTTLTQHAGSVAHGVAIALTWVVLLLVLNVWITYVLRQFAFTRYWGERATEWMLGVAQQVVSGVAEAVPGLLTAVLIFFLARLVVRANTALMQRIENGGTEVTWLDRDTAGPTRRIGNFVIWLFALALAYPFLPGSSSDAFKGVSVLAGLMLSLGASGVVGQIMAGLSLMYSRSLRRGEYVRAGGIEGTVTAMGLFTIKIHTGLGEEVSVPNTVVVGAPIQNYSRLAHGQFILHTAVTIGYATPWRQVHAMLLEAARRCRGPP